MKFRNAKDDFQTKMRTDILKNKPSPKVFISADKKTDVDKLVPKGYKKLLYENIAKTYKKSTNHLKNAINMEAKNTG